MTTLVGIGLVGCAALAGAAVASVPRGTSLVPVAFAAVLGGVLAARVVRRAKQPPPDVSRMERLAALLPLAFFVPMLTMPVAPGADMAMHAALGRALAQGSTLLSPAWGQVNVALYPRGLSAVVALASTVLGFPLASLFSAGLSYLVVVIGAAAFFRFALGLGHPTALAAIMVLASNAPQSFFGWGGNPTAMAFGLGLVGVAWVARAWNAEQSAWSAGLMAAFLGLGAIAVHPTGALAGLMALAVLPARSLLQRARPRREGLVAAGVLVAAVGLGMLALKTGGPVFSVREKEWIAGNQHGVEHVLRGPEMFFAFRIWEALTRVLGWPWVVACAIAVLQLARSREGRVRVLGSAVTIVAIAGWFVMGPALPEVGTLVLPLRFAPLLALATAPLLGWAMAGVAERWPRLGLAGWSGLVILALARNIAVYQREKPIATRADLAAIACAGATVEGGAVIDGAYGDATQWIPALIGRPVTAPHPHISLSDEIEAQVFAPIRYRFVGERLRYGGEPARTPVPATEPICRVGRAALYRL